MKKKDIGHVWHGGDRVKGVFVFSEKPVTQKNADEVLRPFVAAIKNIAKGEFGHLRKEFMAEIFEKTDDEILQSIKETFFMNVRTVKESWVPSTLLGAGRKMAVFNHLCTPLASACQEDYLEADIRMKTPKRFTAEKYIEMEKKHLAEVTALFRQAVPKKAKYTYWMSGQDFSHDLSDPVAMLFMEMFETCAIFSMGVQESFEEVGKKINGSMIVYGDWESE